jgi:hypothetical protein
MNGAASKLVGAALLTRLMIMQRLKVKQMRLFAGRYYITQPL